MHLYNLTLVAPSNITAAVVGQFSGTRQQEIIVCRAGVRLELLRPDANTGKLHSILQQDTFGTVRSLASFRLTGGTLEYLLIGSDSGRITVARYDQRDNALRVVHQETFGRSGARRIVAGQYLATDPKGRACMVAAVEKSKLVYILNRDAEANLTISSPLEAHRPNAIIHAIVGVDVGYENPIFAALEVDYDEADRDPTGRAVEEAQKMLTYYELDLGLNHVVRRWSSPVDRQASHLVQVPGGYNQNTERWEGPSGVLVCAEDHITYKHSIGDEHRIPIPRRYNPIERPEARRGSIIVASVCHRMKAAFFFLLQNEDGDLFKVTMEHEGEEVQSIRIKYFDTVPVAANLCILRAGFLYVASEAGQALLYSFQKLGDEDGLPEYSSADLPRFGMTDVPPTVPTFTPRPLENLLLTDEGAALDPLLDAKLLSTANDAEETPKMVMATGKGPRASIKLLQYGLDVQEAISSELPGVPRSVWTTKLRASDEYDSYIILSFVNGTLVLSIGETIEEVSDSGLLTTAPTLAIQQLGEDALLQVHPEGIRHILYDKQVNEWSAPETSEGDPSRIVQACTNGRQVVVALEPSNELVYFELDMDGQLNEYQDRKAMGSAILCMSMADVPSGRQRTPYLAVGCQDQTVRILSLDPDNTLASLSIQALTAPPHSICVAEMDDLAIDRHHATLFVNIGLTNGVLLRTVLDPVTGQLTDTRLRFLGAKPVRLVRVRMPGQGATTTTAVLALSTRTWLSYTHQQRTHFTPLLFDGLDHVGSFSAELCPDGLIGISKGTLRIFTVPQLGHKFKVDQVAVSGTPRRVAVHPNNSDLVYVVEADHRTLSSAEQYRRLAALESDLKGADLGVLALDKAQFGPIRAEAGRWSSCIQVIDLQQSQSGQEGQKICTLEMDNDEACISLALVHFVNDPFNGVNGHAASTNTNGNGVHGNGMADPASLYLVVGSTVEAHVSPRSSTTNFLSVYRLEQEGRSLQLLHKTEVDAAPTALRAFGGRLLAGVGKALRIYDLGRKKLLRKCENKSFPTAIATLSTQANRIVVGDVQESTFFVTYKALDNRFIVFADDTLPRWTTATCLLDRATVCAGDRFGNIFINRIDDATDRAVEDDPTGLTLLHEKPYLHGAPHKVALEAHYHLGDIVTSLHRTPLVAGGRAVVVYTCLGGTVGCLVPLTHREDVEMLGTLERLLRQEPTLNLLGRDHLAYRGSFTPVKSIIDGDLCEAFASLPLVRQRALAQEFDRTPAEMNKKLDSIRTTHAL